MEPTNTNITDSNMAVIRTTNLNLRRLRVEADYESS